MTEVAMESRAMEQKNEPSILDLICRDAPRRLNAGHFNRRSPFVTQPYHYVDDEGITRIFHGWRVVVTSLGDFENGKQKPKC